MKTKSHILSSLTGVSLVIGAFTLTPTESAMRSPSSDTNSALLSQNFSSEDPVSALNEMQSLLNQVKHYAYSIDVPHLKGLQIYTDRVLDALNDPNRGLGHKETFEAFISLITAVDGAELFLRVSLKMNKL